MRLPQICISFLLIFGSANVFAEFAELQVVRAYPTQGVAFERGGQRNPQQSERENDRPRGRDSALPESSGYGVQGYAGPQTDSMRRQGRLSPEERRALRRQIDEAGQDIYMPKR